MNNEALKPLVEKWLSEKYPSANKYEPTFQVDHIAGEGSDFLSIDSELYSYSFDASLIIGLSQEFPNTEISINETQDGLSIFMHIKELSN